MDEPKKYIRTFAGDVEFIKKGWTPNLTPLKKVSYPPVPKPTEVQTPSSVQSIPQTAPMPKEPQPSPIQTYAGDFLDRIKETNASTATVLAAEQDASPGAQVIDEDPSHRGNTLYIIAGAVLLVLGVVGSYVAYIRYVSNIQPIILTPTVSAPIFVDEKEKISGTTSKNILQAIEQSTTRALATNEVRLLYTESATTTGNDIFYALQLPAPGALLRNVNVARSMVGIVNAGGSQNPFFILSVDSYSDTFAGMLSWEKTIMRDLSTLFRAYPQTQISTTTVATSTARVGTKTSTSTSPVPVFVQAFRDEVVANHDVRVYRDAGGRSVLLYGYWNQTTLVIARDPAALVEIIGRLATMRTRP